jgi:sugar phosphate isomerase/epimerase
LSNPEEPTPFAPPLGLNPYGLAYTVGLQAIGTRRANLRPIGIDGFIALVRERNLPVIELDWRWLTPLSDGELSRIRDRVDGLSVIYSYWLAQEEGETLDDAVHRASAVGARILRLHLTPVLEGARAAWGSRWDQMVAHARATLRRDVPRALQAGLIVGIENHQDLGSGELVDLAEELGERVGIVLDTGNPFAVAEDPVAFARRAAHRICHVHLKDYVAQFTDEGYRLVRCAIGDGCVPLREIAAVLATHGSMLTASIEPGALECRHIRLFTPDWWSGYPARDASELGTLLGRLQRNRLDERTDCRTPWERGATGREIIAYEIGQMRRSIENLEALGWMGATAHRSQE